MSLSKSKSSFFLLLLSGTCLMVILSLFLSTNFDFRSLAKEGGVRVFKMKPGERAVIFCRGLYFDKFVSDNHRVQTWTCRGESADKNEPRPESNQKVIYLHENQTARIECPNIMRSLSYTSENEYVIDCFDDAPEVTPIPTIAPFAE